jgi:hypothetical protein
LSKAKSAQSPLNIIGLSEFAYSSPRTPCAKRAIGEGGSAIINDVVMRCGNFATGEEIESRRQILHSGLRAPDAI